MKKKRLIILTIVFIAIILIGGNSNVREKLSLQWGTEAEEAVSIEPSAETGVHIPAIQLPEDPSRLDMLLLVVYKGKIYTQTDSYLPVEHASELRGEKLGMTINSLHEWSKQDDFAVEFASNIGVTDIYAVKGYDPGFRIMSYTVYEGQVFAEIFESLRGMTVTSGADFLGKLNLSSNIVKAQYRGLWDWYVDKDHMMPLENLEVVNRFVDRLDDTVPISREEADQVLGNYQKEERWRGLYVELKDGIGVHLAIVREGYIYYGTSEVFFRMDDPVFSELWHEMETVVKPKVPVTSIMKDALSDFRTAVVNMTQEEADAAFVKLESQYRKDLDKIRPAFLDEAYGFATLALSGDDPKLEDVMTLQHEDSRQLAMDVIEGGYKLIADEGVVLPIVDYEALFEFKPYLTEAMGAYLDFMAMETNLPTTSDAAIVIDWTALGERAVMAEQVLRTYPDSIQREKVWWQYYDYVYKLLFGSGNTEVFEYEQRGVFREKVQRGYDALLADYGETVTADILRDYMAYVDELVEKYPNQDDPNQDRFFTEWIKFDLLERVTEKFGNSRLG